MTENRSNSPVTVGTVIPDGKGGFAPCLELMTKTELLQFLRIPEISKAKNHDNVIENLVRMHDLPRIHLCGRSLYPRQAIEEWVRSRTDRSK